MCVLFLLSLSLLFCVCVCFQLSYQCEEVSHARARAPAHTHTPSHTRTHTSRQVSYQGEVYPFLTTTGLVPASGLAAAPSVTSLLRLQVTSPPLPRRRAVVAAGGQAPFELVGPQARMVAGRREAGGGGHS